MKPQSNWNDFVQDGLINTGLIDGVSLITHQSVCVYSHGFLADLDENNWVQFTSVFKYATSQHDRHVCQQGFVIHGGPTLQGEIRYTIYEKTFCSAYATAEGGRNGLVVCNLPYGILICSCGPHHHMCRVIQIVESFCDKLRA